MEHASTVDSLVKFRYKKKFSFANKNLSFEEDKNLTKAEPSYSEEGGEEEEEEEETVKPNKNKWKGSARLKSEESESQDESSSDEKLKKKIQKK